VLAVVATVACAALFYSWTTAKEIPAELERPVDRSDDEALVEDVEEEGQDDDFDGDVVDADQDGVDVEAEKAEAKANKEKYDNALSMAQKLQKGERWLQAAEKYSEAIDLLSVVPTEPSAVVLYYNNRSAMYEKAGDEYYSMALDDIGVVLTFDGNHMTSRKRRARIYEAQGKSHDSLVDYTVHFYLEQSRGIQQPTSATKVEEISKAIATANSVGILKRIRSGETGRGLPNKSYSRNFFDLFPSTHHWKAKYENTTIESFIDKIGDIPSLEVLLDVVCCAISLDSYGIAFKYVAKAAELKMVSSESKSLLSLCERLQGMEKHLCCNLSGAAKHYDNALDIEPNNFETLLLRTGISLELAQIEEAQQKFNEILLSTIDTDNDSALKNFIEISGKGEVVSSSSSDDIVASLTNVDKKIELAYGLFHRAAVWTFRNSNNKYRDSAIELAEQDLKLVLSLLKDVGDSGSSANAAKRIYVITLLKSIQLLGQTKGQAGLPQTQEDIETCKSYIIKARDIDPNNISVVQLHSDVLAMENKFDEASELIEVLMKITDADDGIPYVMKANMLTHRGMTYAQQGNSDPSLIQKTQETLGEASKLYEEALQIEPNCVEAMAQACQLKCIIGDMDGAMVYADKAVPLARSSEEVHDLEHLRVQTSAQVEALKEIYKTQSQ